nr:MAG TPA: hypothetical protein [Caudoviricetes sp.]
MNRFVFWHILPLNREIIRYLFVYIETSFDICSVIFVCKRPKIRIKL